MNELKDMIINLFRLEPYSLARYNLASRIQNKENELGLRTNYYNLDIENKTVKCDLLKKVKGLYETIDTFNINNIRIFERND